MTSTLSERRVGAQRPRLHLAPADTVSSAGAEAEKLARSCGLVLDDWQSWCLHGMLAERGDGSWGAQTIALILPRQNGKNAVLEALELAAIFLFGEQFIIHSAHLNETARTHMERMKALVKANHELSKLARFYDSNGKERMVRRDTGAEIRFMTRGQKTLRGGSPSRIVFDEALFLTGAQVQAIVPSLSAQSLNDEGAPQMIYTSSAPLPESSVLHRIRRRGIEGTARNMFFAEWGCELGVDPNDRDAWYESNPGMGVRIGEQWVEDNELTILEPDGFLIERLGVVYPEVDDQADREVKLPAEKWAVTVTDDPPTDSDVRGKLTVGWEVARDGEWSSIGVGVGDIRQPYVELIEHRKGTGWLPERLVELVQRWNPIAVGCIGAGPSGTQVGAVLAAFQEAEIDPDLLHMMSMTDYRSACGGFYTDVTEGRLERAGGQGPLDVAAGDATEKDYGSGWIWDQRSAAVPITPLVAVTVARALLPTVDQDYDVLESVL